MAANSEENDIKIDPEYELKMLELKRKRDLRNMIAEYLGETPKTAEQ